MTLELAEHSVLRDSVLQVLPMPVSKRFLERFRTRRLLSLSSRIRVPSQHRTRLLMRCLVLELRYATNFPVQRHSRHISKGWIARSIASRRKSTLRLNASTIGKVVEKDPCFVVRSEMNWTSFRKRARNLRRGYQMPVVVAARPFAPCPRGLWFSGFVRSWFDRSGARRP